MKSKFPPQALSLNDGHQIPQIGLGVWQLSPEDTYSSVRAAIEAGYRHIDTARIYENEESVGKAIKDAISAGDISREELFVTTKLWNPDQGAARTQKACQDSLQRLGLEYMDLYLIHWPTPALGLYRETYSTFVNLREQGLVRSIGVSNFYISALEEIIGDTGVVPVVNQIELHPGFSQQKLRDYHHDKGIITEAWSPLGQGTILSNDTIEAVAHKYGVTPAQVILRWHIQLGVVALPRSSKAQRVVENFSVWNFQLTEEDMKAITALDAEDGRIGKDPATVNLGI